MNKVLASIALRSYERTPEAPLLRPASFDDLDAMRAVQTAHGLSVKAHPEWLRLWHENPAYKSLTGWPIGWVLETRRGRIVGALENIPSFCFLDGQRYTCAFGRGWAVDASYRSYGLLLQIQQMSQPNVDLIWTNTVNARTHKVLSGLGWREVPAGQWDRSALWITSYAEVLQRYLMARAPFVSSIAGPVLGLGSRLGGLQLRDRRRRLPYEWEWCSNFDTRFDEFWDALQGQRPGLLLSCRSRESLEWHYASAMARGQMLLLTAKRDSRLIAYAVFVRRDIRDFDLKRELLIDLQALRDEPGLVAAMMIEARRRLRLENVQILENLGCWLEATHPRFGGLRIRRRLGHWSYLYYAANKSLAERLPNPDFWYPTQYDADASL